MNVTCFASYSKSFAQTCESFNIMQNSCYGLDKMSFNPLRFWVLGLEPQKLAVWEPKLRFWVLSWSHCEQCEILSSEAASELLFRSNFWTISEPLGEWKALRFGNKKSWTNQFKCFANLGISLKFNLENWILGLSCDLSFEFFLL